MRWVSILIAAMLAGCASKAAPPVPVVAAGPAPAAVDWKSTTVAAPQPAIQSPPPAQKPSATAEQQAEMPPEGRKTSAPANVDPPAEPATDTKVMPQGPWMLPDRKPSASVEDRTSRRAVPTTASIPRGPRGGDLCHRYTKRECPAGCVWVKGGTAHGKKLRGYCSSPLRN